MAQKLKWGLSKNTFLRVDQQVVVLKSLEQQFQVLPMSFDRRAGKDDIVHVDKNEWKVA